MTIVLTQENKTTLTEMGYGSIIIADSFTTFPEMYVRFPEADIEKILTAIKLPLTYKQALELGYFADLDALSAYLRVSPIFRLAALSAGKNATFRKLFFEVNYWLTSEVGQRSPALLLGSWLELIAYTRGSLLVQLTTAEVDEWNRQVALCRLDVRFKLVKA